MAIDVERALLRGEFAKAVAVMERVGIPIDMVLFTAFGTRLEDLRRRLASRSNMRFPRVFDGTAFSEDGWAWNVRRRGWWWPEHKGRLMLDSETFDDMVDYYPEVRFLRDARWMMKQTSHLKLAEAIGKDGRNRTGLVPWQAKTSRGAPSTSRFILGAPAFVRSFVQAPPGRAVLYADYGQQEYAIMAQLSGDAAMLEAYKTGDPYFEFARAARAVPPDAVRKRVGADGVVVEEYEAIREVYKTATLAIAYGQGSASLARRLHRQPSFAERLLEQNRRVYPVLWKWSDRVSVTMQMHGRMHTEHGWQIWLSELTDNSLSIRNWPVQSLGSDILRAACILAVRRGILVCAPLHDALLVECRAEDVAVTKAALVEVMQEAGAILLGDFKLRVDVAEYVHPAHFFDKRGAETWAEIRDLLGVSE